MRHKEWVFQFVCGYVTRVDIRFYFVCYPFLCAHQFENANTIFSSSTTFDPFHFISTFLFHYHLYFVSILALRLCPNLFLFPPRHSVPSLCTSPRSSPFLSSRSFSVFFSYFFSLFWPPSTQFLLWALLLSCFLCVLTHLSSFTIHFRSNSIHSKKNPFLSSHALAFYFLCHSPLLFSYLLRFIWLLFSLYFPLFVWHFFFVFLLVTAVNYFVFYLLFSRSICRFSCAPPRHLYGCVNCECALRFFWLFFFIPISNFA